MDFEQTFARADKSLLSLLGDSAALDIAGDGVTLVPVKGEFAAPWLQPRIGSLRTEIIEPQFTVDQSVDLSAVVEGTTTLTVKASVYEVVDLQPDGTGLTVLVLRPLD